MPRKSTGEKLEKVVSTKISDNDFMVLQKYAKIHYNADMILQPTISHLLRLIIKNWAKDVKDKERPARGRRQHYPAQIELDDSELSYSATQKAKQQAIHD